jgi:AmmeMemoRadiSam system protein A
MDTPDGGVLLGLARWVIERWCADEPWREGGPGLDAVRDIPVDGLFVTLKTGVQLRGCIGTVERQPSLDAILREMAIQAAGSDPRFSPVSGDELAAITISLSLLTPPLQVENEQDIVIGRDGLILEQRGRRGLLLPEVPVELGWDVDTYLEELCRKAFLPPGAWRDAGSTLHRFESIQFSEAAGP